MKIRVICLSKRKKIFFQALCVCLLSNIVTPEASLAQSVRKLSQLPTPIPQNIVPPIQLPPRQTPKPKPEPLPLPEQLLVPPSSTTPSPTQVPEPAAEKITVKQFQITGSTIFSKEQLDKIVAPYTNRPLSATDIFQLQAAITNLYIRQGYITSGALIPPQTIQNGIVKIQIVEGTLEAINVTGTKRLNPNYISTRLPNSKPLNQKRLLSALKLLRLNPLIKKIQAELTPGSNLDTTVLNVRVLEAKTFSTQISADNGRSPSVGTFRRSIQFNEANLLGLGDGLSLAYSNTDGSNGIDASYSLPINSRNGTISINYGFSNNSVIEKPFNALDIIGNYRYYQLTLQQPVIETPNRELLLGISATRNESDIYSNVLKNLGYPLPFLSPGANDEGNTRISTINFFQQWTNRSANEVFAARSLFSLGIGAFDATVNNSAPDSRFFSWLGQVQWVRQVAPGTLLLVRSNFQLADRPLVPQQQFGLGGIDSVRGYRQDALLGDNGFFASAEFRLPIYRNSKQNLLLQLTPFVDFGTTWDSGRTKFSDRNFSNSDTLASVGLGLRFQLNERLTARFDWGIPLIDIDTRERTWQEKGLYFSINYNPF